MQRAGRYRKAGIELKADHLRAEWEAVNRLREAYYPPVNSILTRFFREQYALVNRQLFSDTKGFQDLDLSKEDDKLRRLLVPIIESIIRGAADSAIERIGALPEDLSILTVDFETLATQIARSKIVNETTGQHIAQIFANGLENNATQDELRGMVREMFTDYENWRVDLITDTVVVGAWEKGTLEAWMGNGVEAKSWLATRDGRTRDSHRAAEANPNNQNVPVDQPFTVGGAAMMHPGDPAGPAKEVVRCRCTMIPAFLNE